MCSSYFYGISEVAPRVLININLWPEICRTCTCLFQDFWKAFPQVGAWSLWRRSLSSPAFSCFTQFFLLFLQHLSGSSSFTGPLKNLSLKRGSSSVAITRHLLFSVSENLLFKEASISDFIVCTPLSSWRFSIVLDNIWTNWMMSDTEAALAETAFVYLFNGRWSSNDFTN